MLTDKQIHRNAVDTAILDRSTGLNATDNDDDALKDMAIEYLGDNGYEASIKTAKLINLWIASYKRAAIAIANIA